MAFGGPLKIQLAAGLDADAPALCGPPGLAPPPGLEPASPDAALAEQVLALQHQRLLLENFMLSQAHVRNMQLLYQSLCSEPKASARLSVSSASTASGDASSDEELQTTVIVKKVPKAFSRDLLVDLLNKRGFQGKFDFVYMPVDFEKNLGTGCAFINFTSTETAEAFKQKFQGFRGWGVRCSNAKKAEVTWSQSCQGFQAHVDRYRDSPVMHPSVPDSFKPALFKDGLRVEFPPPRRVLKAPQQHNNA